MTFFERCEANITGDLYEAQDELRQALWRVPADMDRAKLLASKIIGLRICAGQIDVKLRPVPREIEREAA